MRAAEVPLQSRFGEGKETGVWESQLAQGSLPVYISPVHGIAGDRKGSLLRRGEHFGAMRAAQGDESRRQERAP